MAIDNQLQLCVNADALLLLRSALFFLLRLFLFTFSPFSCTRFFVETSVIDLVRLETSFGICGTVLAWLRSFLSDRQQAVSFHGITSVFHSVACGVPQGSVLGPLLFLLYTADVALIAHRYHVAVHSYADDTQLYTSCSATDAPTSAAQLLCGVRSKRPRTTRAVSYTHLTLPTNREV